MPDTDIPFDDPFAPNQMKPGDSDGHKKDKPGKKGEVPDDELKEKKRKGLWLNKEELLEVKKNIEMAIEYQKAEDRWDKWHEYLDYLNCRWDNGDMYYEDTVNVNSIFSNLQTELPTLYFQHPNVNVHAKRPHFTGTIETPQGPMKMKYDNIHGAKLLGIRLNQIFDDIGIEQTVERGIVDALAPYGYCVWKVGYGFQTEFDKTLDQEVTKTTYWVRRVDPRNVLVDPMAPSFRERSFTAERICRQKKKVLKNKLYETESVRKMKTKIPEVYKRRFEQFGEKYKTEIIEFYEYHDHDKKTVHWVAIDGTPMEIREPVSRKKSWIEGSDYVFSDLNVATDDSAYPVDDITPVVDQAKARNRIRSSQVKHYENWGLTVFLENDFFINDEDEEVYKKLGNNVGVFRVGDGAISGQKIQIVDAPRIPPDLYQMDEIHRRDNDETLGISEYQRGGAVQGATATEAQIVANNSNVRISRRRRKVKLAIIEISKKLAALISRFDDAGDVLNVASEVEDDGFVQYVRKNFDPDFSPEVPFLMANRKAWQGDYNFNFEIEEMVERPKAVQIQQLMNTITQLYQIPTLAPVVNEAMDAKHVVRKIFELQGMFPEHLKRQSLTPLIPPDLENDMADRGIEIPPPNKMDDHMRHIFQHMSLTKEMTSKMPLLMQAAVNTATGEMKNPEAMQAYLQVKKSIQLLKQHVVEHYKMDQADAQNAAMMGQVPGGGGTNQSINGPRVPAQIAGGQQQPGAPTEMGIARNAGAVTPGSRPSPRPSQI